MVGASGRRDARRILGRRAEALAFRFLRRHGLCPVARNVRCRLGEIDLVMLDGCQLVFIEVRYRSGRRLADAIETVDRHKQRKLLGAARYFLSRNRRWQDHACRFDVVGVDVDDDGSSRMRWLRDAFRPGH